MEGTDNQPQFLPATTFGQSAVRNMSRLWGSRQDTNSSALSPAPGKSFVVPLFLSRNSARNDVFARGALPTSTRSRASTRSVIEDSVQGNTRVQPLSVPRDAQSEVSDMYAGSTRRSEHAGSVPLARNMDDDPTPSERHAMRSYRSNSSNSTHSSKRSSKKRGIFSKRSYRDPDVSAKAKISLAFGVTLLVALVIYLVLAATGIAKNTMFHVISILFLLSLTGVFVHQLLRMFILIRRPRRSRHRTAHGSRRGHTRGQTRTTRQRTRKPIEPEHVPEKPIPIHMTSDTGFGPDVEAHPIVQPPPPVYGNFRGSMRIDPNLVHWKEVQTKNPSPLTPTYDEAMSQVHQTMGYRPPSYLSETGATEVIETQRRDVEAALENIHPLERARMRNMAAEALEGRRG
ncbi:hypothetical protein H2200_006774 [Cladophialophora chaetospira]|uniref:Uncharacterized protein n=1 Tax=Cladophialophora chaetospira TaxID=386627 RepID=A0AA38X8U8_9EURO|nr:hypothetical protein H2200_006774 [Cladophialophora chaetospira]